MSFIEDSTAEFTGHGVQCDETSKCREGPEFLSV